MITEADKKRLSLFRTMQANPSSVMHLLDEIKKQAVETLRATLATAEPKVLRELETRVNAVYENYKKQVQEMLKLQGEEFLKKLNENVDAKIDKIRVIKGEKGEKGDSPSMEYLISIMKPLIPEPVHGVTPSNEQLQELMKPMVQEVVANMMPTAQEIADRQKSFDDAVEAAVTKAVADKISQVKRFGGGGSGDRVKAGDGITISENTIGQKVITASGSASVLTATGTVDDSNADFTFTSKPLIICVNGAFYRENNGWTWDSGTLTATLDNPVGTGGDIYGLV